ncbi:Short-chain dehydrogenase [Streptomyces sp. DvalAA-14]|uniref:SDR family NAD(P)-dependent oxidoreductase n=1 Tax=unclassified Streptomyces TaxID=2593676 RepID=UPI00081B8D8B|nr:MULTISPECIES: SDR family NAD(P)-dependent oxidoreductase [unclassified Streptomyces]MYS22734.1 SDR family NAD(P)-dependent oxidoreductase [Streptomyces sp. SID4948]SCE21545.1 Short-chain dehydrogenase [Streptomyces sp. DvalAA-14]
MPVAIITGASRGLGQALAAELAGRGWDLVLDGRNAGALRSAAAGLTREARSPQSAPGRIRAVPGDVTDAGHRAELVAAALSLGGVDLLVNNASALGAEPLVALAELPEAGLRQALETNVIAPFALIRAALPALRAAGGAVVNVSSDAAVAAYATWGGYGASKAALDHMSAVLAEEEPRVRVWWVDPGELRTELYAEAVPDDAGFADRLPPGEVAPAFARLLDDRAPSGRYTAAALRAAR